MRKRADVAREVLAELGTLMQPAECAAGRRKEKLDKKIAAFLNIGKG
jgi:hypothetical protein